MAGINIKIGTISTKFHYPYEGIFGKASPGPEYIIKEVTGNEYINLTNAVANSLMELKVYGGTKQNGTPTPTSPIDIISNNGAIKVSNNLLDMTEENIVMGKFIDSEGAIKDSINNFYNGKYIPVISSEEYTRSTSENVKYISIMEYDRNKIFIKRTLFNNGTSGKKSGSLILQNNTSFILFGSNPFATEITLNDIISVKWKFEKGNIATPYNPYGLIYTDGTVETIKAHGKNLFDKNSSLVNGYINSSGAIVLSGQLKISPFIEIKPNTTYTLSGTGDVKALTYDRYAYTYTAEQTPIAQIPSQTGGASATFTTAQNAKYIRIQITTDAVNTCQLELGSTATEYVPYFDGGTATAEMLLKVGDYVDEQEILSGNITRKVGIKVLDGTEDWSRTDARTKLVLTNSAIGLTGTWKPYCTHYQSFVGGVSVANMSDNSCKINVSTQDLLIKDATHNIDLATWKQYLADQYAAGTPVIVLYPLATSTTESVAGQTMNIPAGNSTIEITQASIDNLGLYAKYKATA